MAVTTAICFIGGGDDRYLLYWWAVNRAVTTRPFREHEITLYYTNGLHTFDSGPQWPVQHSGMHGPNNFFPGCIFWLADIHFRGEDARFRHRIEFTKRPQWYKTKAAVYVGTRTATLHMEEDGKTVSWVEACHPIEWCTVTILNQDLEQRGTLVKRRRAVSR